MRIKKILSFAILSTVFIYSFAHASIAIPMFMTSTNGKGENIGTITAEKSLCGILLTPNLHGLPPGIHGFHIHVKPDCDNNGMAAEGHFDPANASEHNGPYNKHSHLGDLPVLIVNQDGNATLPTLAPRFTLDELKNHAIIIHASGDNYSDKPEKLGGGGSRIACGIIGEQKKPENVNG